MNPVEGKISGLELVTIASMLCGEGDFNYSNVGIIPSCLNEDSTKKEVKVVRYDFALSDKYCFPQYYIGNYVELAGILGIKPDSNLLREKIQQLSNTPIQDLYDVIDQKIDCLKAAGFNFDLEYSDAPGIVMGIQHELFTEKRKTDKKIKRDDVKLTNQNYKDVYKENIKCLLDILIEFNHQIHIAIETGLVDTSSSDWMVHEETLATITNINISQVNAVSDQLVQGVSSLAIHTVSENISLIHPPSVIKEETVGISKVA